MYECMESSNKGVVWVYAHVGLRVYVSGTIKINGVAGTAKLKYGTGPPRLSDKQCCSALTKRWGREDGR